MVSVPRSDETQKFALTMRFSFEKSIPKNELAAGEACAPEMTDSPLVASIRVSELPAFATNPLESSLSSSNENRATKAPSEPVSTSDSR